MKPFAPTLLILSILLVSCAPAAAPQAPAPTFNAAELPNDYTEVQADYAAIEQLTLEQSARVSELLAAGDLQAIYDHFDPALQAQMSFKQLQNTVSDFTRVAPLGEVLDTHFVSLRNQHFAITVHRWAEHEAAVYTTFSQSGAVQSLAIKPIELDALDPAVYPASPVAFRLPFDGLVYTLWGGADELRNYHVTVPFQQFACDFSAWVDGSVCRAGCSRNEDYYAFGQPVLAPADGEVTEAVSDQPDGQPGSLLVQTDPGNYVILKVAEGEYLFMCHLLQNSVRVGVGDTVRAGDVIGQVGNSGRSSEPHLHIHLQDSPRFDVNGVTGLPLYFFGYQANGESMASGMPLGGQFVQNGE
jgi:hypothetical protein